MGKVRTRITEFFRSHLMGTVVLFLISTWLGISWLVYRAEFKAQGSNITNYGEGVWWGIVTFLTVGYGDRYPITVTGRILGSFLMLAGVGAVGIVTAKISSYFLEQALREGRGLVDTSRLKSHFIVCGWKEEMEELLSHILDFNPGLSADKLVMVAHLAQDKIDVLKEHPRLKGLHVVNGEYFHESHLRRAAPERAKKILILADRTPTASGAVASPTEVDARTIMTAMTLSNIARNTLVTAEILDPKMDHYLKLANVSEIIYTREYSRLLVGNASGGTGVSNIIFDLLDPKTPTVITTHAIDDKYLGHEYPAFKKQYELDHPEAIVVGVLENTGNSHHIKEMALKQAQKTPDVKRLVQNLKSIKDIKCNHPVFNPTAEYVIPEGAMAIVIENRKKKYERSDTEKTDFFQAA